MKYRIVDVAKALGVSPETVREGLKLGVYDFGVAFQKQGKTNYTYVLYPKVVERYIGEVNGHSN